MSALLDIAGAVHLDLRLEADRICAVTLTVARPAAAATLRGRNADAAARLLPLLYSICSQAQGAAARLAVAAARGTATAPYIDDAVLKEARREHLWRLLLDWPSALGLPREDALLAAGCRHLQSGGYESWRDAALSAPLARLDAALGEQADSVMPTRWLPPVSAAQTLAHWPRLDAAFAAAPWFQGAPAETGALARHAALAGKPMPAAEATLTTGTTLAIEATLAARVRARMADLFDAAGLGAASATAVAPGIGRAVVETARGLLMHEVVIEQERVVDYTIVAPTEWNFHATGVLPAGLQGLTAPTPAALRARVARHVLALDPCVACEIDLAA